MIKEGIKSDSFEEEFLRAYGEGKARGSCFNVYDIYKKGHG